MLKYRLLILISVLAFGSNAFADQLLKKDMSRSVNKVTYRQIQSQTFKEVMNEAQHGQDECDELELDERSSMAGKSSNLDLRNDVSKLAKIVKARSDLKYASIKKQR